MWTLSKKRANASSFFLSTERKDEENAEVGRGFNSKKKTGMGTSLSGDALGLAGMCGGLTASKGAGRAWRVRGMWRLSVLARTGKKELTSGPRWSVVRNGASQGLVWRGAIRQLGRNKSSGPGPVGWVRFGLSPNVDRWFKTNLGL